MNRTFAGDTVYATSFEMAQAILDSTRRGYMRIDGRLVAEVRVSDDEVKKLTNKLKSYEKGKS